MKATDDYNAKLDLWAREGRVYAQPKIANLPRFGSKSFSSYEEMNAWKKELLEELQRQGGPKWEM